jgi:hypothetical protein
MLKHSPRLRRGNIHWFRLGLVFGLVLVSSLVWSWFGLGFVFGFVLVWSWFGLWVWSWFGLGLVFGLVLVWSWFGLGLVFGLPATYNLQPTVGLEPTSSFWAFYAPPGGRSNLLKEGLRDRNSPTCTLSQNGYGDFLITPPRAITFRLLALPPRDRIKETRSNN